MVEILVQDANEDSRTKGSMTCVHQVTRQRRVYYVSLPLLIGVYGS